MQKNHPFHLVNPSPWPLVASFSAFTLSLALVAIMHNWNHSFIYLFITLSLVFSSMFFWWTDVINEGKYDQAHNQYVQKGLRLGMILFIGSELFFFAAFFGAFFYLKLAPVNIFTDIWTYTKGIWPPQGIKVLDAWNLPFLNTIILLLSGTSLAWADNAILYGKKKEVTYGLTLTILLGILFTLIQAYEYHHAGFGFKAEGYQSFYASLFYMCTGFHGLHVIIGTIFLIICLIRNLRGSLTKENHLSLQFASWYWHFVDAVWIFLFIFMYVLN